jgi:hypothetical protein
MICRLAMKLIMTQHQRGLVLGFQSSTTGVYYLQARSVESQHFHEGTRKTTLFVSSNHLFLTLTELCLQCFQPGLRDQRRLDPHLGSIRLQAYWARQGRGEPPVFTARTGGRNHLRARFRA